MGPVFGRFDVRVVALSPDTVEKAQAHRRRDELSCELLCDPDLSVVGLLGLVHRRGLVHNTVHLWGIPLGVPIGFRELAIPTSILLDEQGVVRWIDQASDYRLRGNAQRIEMALESAFPVGGSTNHPEG